MNKLSQAWDIAVNADVTTPPNSLVLYSISYQPTANNKLQALKYLKSHSECRCLDDTPCGKALISLNLETGNNNPDTEVLKIWALASQRFILAASGEVIAFVENADKRSTFVSVELPLLLQNERITKINNQDKFEFAKQFL